jgi:hypothetical protein
VDYCMCVYRVWIVACIPHPHPHPHPHHTPSINKYSLVNWNMQQSMIRSLFIRSLLLNFWQYWHSRRVFIL